MKLPFKVETLDKVDAAFHKLYTERDGQFVFSGVDGMKTAEDIERLQGALTKERADHKRIKERFSVLGDRDVNELLSELDKLEEYKQAAEGKLDDNKLNSMVETRLKSRVAPLERDRDNLTKQLKEALEQVGAFEQRERTRTIHDAARAAIAKSTGFVPGASEDVLLYAERMLEIDDRGNVVSRDSVGVTPGVDPVVWLQEMQSKKPYWWGTTSGGGASNGRGAGGAGGDNPWTAAGWNMTKQGQLYKENPERAAQLARSAGTTIGGAKPVK